MNRPSHLDFRILKQKNPRGYNAILYQLIYTDIIRRPLWAERRNHFFGFRNSNFATGPEKPEAGTILFLLRLAS
jgi:hypothetical protein